MSESRFREICEIYAQYKEVFSKTASTWKLMPYDWVEFPNPISANWMPYKFMFDEFSTGLANVINEMSYNIRAIKAWSWIIDDLTNEQKYEITKEFISDKVTLSLNLPYVIKSRFSFSITHLCHQANRVSDQWEDDLPLDREIPNKPVDKYCEYWSSYRDLCSSLEFIDNVDYRESTRNFRNIYSHRLQPRIVIGLYNIASRHVSKGNISYRFGGHEPLQLEDIACSLERQSEYCYNSFELFQSLVYEHVRAIAEANRGVISE